METGAYLQKLAVTHVLREPAIRSAIQALQLPPGSRGLDAGCGIGLHSPMLAEAVGPTGHVTGLDICPEFLAYAREMAERVGLSTRVSFQEGNVNELPFEDDTFDWVWSADCVGYPTAEPVRLLKELARVVKAGGSVAILFWSSQQLLPGYPLLEARLNTTTAGIAPFTEGMRPELHSPRALGWFRDAGFGEPVVHTIAGSVHAPLGDDLRDAMISLLQMRWEGAESEVSQEDWAKYQHLCQPESPDFLLDHPDYYAFFTYSMFTGWVVE